MACRAERRGRSREGAKARRLGLSGLRVFPSSRDSSLVVCLCLLCALVGCSNAAKREAVGLGAVVDQYRRAENAGKAAKAEAVVSFACTDAEVCAAKDACLAAISPTVRALGLKDEVAARLADLEARRLSPDAPEAAALPAKLDEAERLLKDGHAKMTACEREMTGLRLKHGG
jgi:hypothetical protein